MASSIRIFQVDEHIISVFDDHLIGKPKLFIIQACRGCKSDFDCFWTRSMDADLAQCNNRSTATSSNNVWSSDSIPNDNNRTSVDSGGYRTTMVPIRSDMAIWYSTVKGSHSDRQTFKRQTKFYLDYVSWRSPDNGSIFIQSLITVFARTAYRYDLARMVTCVRSRIHF